MPDSRQKRQHGLPPVIGDNAEILILGSFPSRMSLDAGEYYANPKNQLWKVMHALFGIDPALPCRQRSDLLIRHRIALWDTVASCARVGSADNRISDPILNNITGLLATHPSIRLIACNGGASARYAARLSLPGTVQLIRLPSTSPAYAAMTLKEKIERWSVIVNEKPI